jgi:hypothetical protein
MSGTLDVIDTSSLRRERRVRVPPMVRAIAYWPEADIVFAAQQFAGRVHLIRLSSGEEVATFRVGGSIREVVWSAEHQTLFVLNHNRLFRFTRDDLIDKFPRIRGDGPESG